MPDAITAGPLPATTPAAQSAGVFSGLDSEAFLKLLVAQLRYQNPLAPSDPSAMLQQTSQLRQVEALNQVAAGQQQLLALHQASIATGLVGRHVSAYDDAGALVEGEVSGVRFTPAGPVLLLGDKQVALDATTEIAAPAA